LESFRLELDIKGLEPEELELEALGFSFVVRASIGF
jgi:hypothetical protein